jgi:hypothetical protein
MRKRYQRWMHDWETRLTTRDTNRVVRPLEWGIEWTRGFPGSDGFSPDGAGPEAFFHEQNRRLVERSDDFYSYRPPTDFRLVREDEQRVAAHDSSNGAPRAGGRSRKAAQFLRFTSAVESPYPENNLANARWFPARGCRAVVVLPQWNADAQSHNGLCRIFNLLGIAALRLSMPYHDVRKPAEIERADYAVSANIGRTIAAARQAIVDLRSCLDWLEQRGYTELGVVGTSLGSCYAFIASAHDPRLRVNAFNHASTYFGDVVWTGQSTRHIRAGLEREIDLESLRNAWLAISPMSYFDKFARWPKKSKVIYTTYDLTFLPEFSRQVVEQFRAWQLDHEVAVLPCGHYTMGQTPYKFMDAWHIARFLNAAL